MLANRAPVLASPQARGHATQRIKLCSARQTVVRSAVGDPFGDADRKEPPRPLGVSFFLPFKSLPPDGEVVHAKEAACDPYTTNCKFAAYVYESKCTQCYGTGVTRSGTRGGSRRGRRGGGGHATLHTCLACQGMGHVRHSSARVLPDISGDIQEVTLARRQKLPGEPEHQLPAPTPAQEKPGRLRKAKELFEKLTGKAAAAPAPSAAPPAANNGNAASNGNGSPVVANNIVTSGGRLSGMVQQEAKQQEAKQQAPVR